MLLPPLALLAIGLGLGLTSGIEEHAAAAAAAFSDRAAYAAAVLGTHGGPIPAGGRVVVPASPAVSAGGVLTDLGQVLAALCVAGIALDRRAAGSAGRWPPAPDGCAACTAAWSVIRSPGWRPAWRCSPPSARRRCTDRIHDCGVLPRPPLPGWAETVRGQRRRSIKTTKTMMTIRTTVPMPI